MMSTVYTIAVSYASEQRYYVEKFVNYFIEKNINIYYDRNEQAQMLGTLLHTGWKSNAHPATLLPLCPKNPVPALSLYQNFPPRYLINSTNP